MNVLKKQKQEEADARRAVETALGALRKEKQGQDKILSGLTENAAKLATQHKELHALATALHAQLQPLLSGDATTAAVPELDTKLIEAVESPEAKPESKPEAKSGGKPDKKGRK